MRPGRTFALLILAAIAFGALVAAIKGQDVGVRDALGNTSAPWVLVPFLAGTRYTRLWQGVGIGVATTLAAFLGFYLAEAAILDLGPHPWTTDLRLTLGSGRIWEQFGLLSGTAYGALGALWASRRFRGAPLAVGLAFLAEPVIVWALVHAGIWGGSGPLEYTWLWLAEILIGVAIASYALVSTPVRPQVRG